MTAATLTLTDFLLARIAETQQWGEVFSPTAPARSYILADCESKRRIVEHCRTVAEDDTEYSGWVYFAEQPMKLLALPYADHPDYREEWKP